MEILARRLGLYGEVLPKRDLDVLRCKREIVELAHAPCFHSDVSGANAHKQKENRNVRNRCGSFDKIKHFYLA